MFPRKDFSCWLSASIGAVALISSAQQALSQGGFEALEQALRESERSERRLDAVRPKNVTPRAHGPLDGDVRRQKEEAAKSLNDTLRDIDDRARTRAIEGGKGVIIQ